jgi:peptidoglycan/LPS O-acetylase OafA/YrhL
MNGIDFTMNPPQTKQSVRYAAARLLFAGLLILCVIQMVPGWNPLHLDWSTEVYYSIMMCSGACAGVARDRRYWPGGLVGGAGAGFGSLCAVMTAVDHFNVDHPKFLAAVALLGSLPGVGMYFLFKRLQDALVGEEDDELGPSSPP